MSKFAIDEIDKFKELGTRKKVFKLTRDRNCFYDDFIEEIKKDRNLEPELDDLTSLVEQAANLKEHPKFKKLKGKNIDGYPLFEAKSKHLRLYATEEHKTGMIIILGGKKTTQPADIDKTRSILKQYKESKK